MSFELFGNVPMSISVFLGGLFLIGYLIGSIPFGLIITRLAGYGDIRSAGSGNIGVTNVLRTTTKPLALLTLIGDMGKGFVPAYLGITMLPELSMIGGHVLAGGAVIGHCFPIWLKFKGGKGVATSLGILLGLYPPLGLAALATWLVVAGLGRYSSLAGLLTLANGPILAMAYDQGEHAAFLLLLAALVWARHHGNIKRLITGQESKIGESAKINQEV